MSEQRTVKRGIYSRRGFLGLAGAAVLAAGCSVATAWADSKDEDANDLWSTARTDVATQTVTDMDGDKVELAQMPQRIADAWADNVAMVCVLNAGVGLVATATSADTKPWLYTIVPTVTEATTTFNQGFSVEDLVALTPDVVFAEDDGLRDTLKSSNIPVVDVDFDSFDELHKAVKLMGQVLGGTAIDKGEKYLELFDQTLKDMGAVYADVNSADRPSVLYGTSVYTGVVDGTDALSNEWVVAAGGRNANVDDEDEDETYAVADVIAMNPDVIVTGTAAEVEQILGDAAWQNVPAVQQGNVFVNPVGMNSWAAPGPELVLQVAWLASKLYPDQVTNDDVVQRAHDLYLDFCDFDASADQVGLMMSAQPPAATENGVTTSEVDYATDEDAKELADSGDIPREGPIDYNLPGMEAQDTVME